MADDSNIPYYLKNVPTFKHLSDPHAYHRYKDVSTLPEIGDFVVCSIDPVASVAHLDKEARQAASRVRPRQYIAFVMDAHGLSIGHEPVNSYGFTFVRQGPPRATRPGQLVFRDFCIPIFPATSHPTARKPIRPAKPLPWNDCYIDTHLDFNFTQVRVSATPRDYTYVLPCGREEILDVMEMMATDGVLRDRRTDHVELGMLDAIASIALPPSPTSAFKIPLPPSPILEEAQLPPDGVVHMKRDVAHTSPELAEDGVSIIASDDATSIPEDNQSSRGSDVDVALLMHLETMFDTSGNVNDPVVNVWHDLDMVPEVIDPVYFLEERAQIRQIISDAEARLGITQAREEAAAKAGGFNPFHLDEVPNAALEAKESQIPYVEPPESNSWLRSKLAFPGRLSSKSLGLLRKGTAFLRTLTCHSARAHDTHDS